MERGRDRQEVTIILKGMVQTVEMRSIFENVPPVLPNTVATCHQSLDQLIEKEPDEMVQFLESHGTNERQERLSFCILISMVGHNMEVLLTVCTR